MNGVIVHLAEMQLEGGAEYSEGLAAAKGSHVGCHTLTWITSEGSPWPIGSHALVQGDYGKQMCYFYPPSGIHTH